MNEEVICIFRWKEFFAFQIMFQCLHRAVNQKSYDKNGETSLVSDLYRALWYEWTLRRQYPLAEGFEIGAVPLAEGFEMPLGACYLYLYLYLYFDLWTKSETMDLKSLYLILEWFEIAPQSLAGCWFSWLKLFSSLTDQNQTHWMLSFRVKVDS